MKDYDQNLEPETDPLEDTDRIQKAIEKVMDDETASLPLIPVPEEAPSEEPEEEDASLHTAADPSSESASTARVHRWFFTFMCMNIPIAGWIYLFYLAFSKKTTDRRDFARAYLFYKLIFLLVSAVILGILIYIGMGLLDQLLAYMEML